MFEDIRIVLVLSEERDGWLYHAISEKLSSVRQRNRSAKLKQILTSGLADNPMAAWAAQKVQTPASRPGPAQQQGSPTIQKSAQRSNPVPKLKSDSSPTIIKGYGDELDGIPMEFNGG